MALSETKIVIDPNDARLRALIFFVEAGYSFEYSSKKAGFMHKEYKAVREILKEELEEYKSRKNYIRSTQIVLDKSQKASDDIIQELEKLKLENNKNGRTKGVCTAKRLKSLRVSNPPWRMVP